MTCHSSLRNGIVFSEREWMTKSCAYKKLSKYLLSEWKEKGNRPWSSKNPQTTGCLHIHSGWDRLLIFSVLPACGILIIISNRYLLLGSPLVYKVWWKNVYLLLFCKRFLQNTMYLSRHFSYSVCLLLYFTCFLKLPPRFQGHYILVLL